MDFKELIVYKKAFQVAMEFTSYQRIFRRKKNFL